MLQNRLKRSHPADSLHKHPFRACRDDPRAAKTTQSRLNTEGFKRCARRSRWSFVENSHICDIQGRSHVVRTSQSQKLNLFQREPVSFFTALSKERKMSSKGLLMVDATQCWWKKEYQKLNLIQPSFRKDQFLWELQGQHNLCLWTVGYPSTTRGWYKSSCQDLNHA